MEAVPSSFLTRLGNVLSRDAHRQNKSEKKYASIRPKDSEKGRRGVKYYWPSISSATALWLKKHGFDERFQATMPEAMAELEKLAKHEEWWARMYVVYIMRQNLVLRRDHILRQLAEDENDLVSEAAKSARE